MVHVERVGRREREREEGRRVRRGGGGGRREGKWSRHHFEYWITQVGAEWESLLRTPINLLNMISLW